MFAAAKIEEQLTHDEIAKRLFDFMEVDDPTSEEGQSIKHALQDAFSKDPGAVAKISSSIKSLYVTKMSQLCEQYDVK